MEKGWKPICQITGSSAGSLDSPTHQVVIWGDYTWGVVHEFLQNMQRDVMKCMELISFNLKSFDYCFALIFDQSETSRSFEKW